MAMLDDDAAPRCPLRLIEDDKKSEDFGTLLNEIDWLLDPDSADPWPRHTPSVPAPASLCARALWPARAEYRLFRWRGIISFSLGCVRSTRASGTPAMCWSPFFPAGTIGRAKGGMADTIARRLQESDQTLDDCMEPAMDRARRAMVRASMRKQWARKQWARKQWPGKQWPGKQWASRADAALTFRIANVLGVSVAAIDRALRHATFGRCWSGLELASPALRRRTVLVKDLARETAIARGIIEGMRADGPASSTDPAGIAHCAARHKAQSPACRLNELARRIIARSSGSRLSKPVHEHNDPARTQTAHDLA